MNTFQQIEAGSFCSSFFRVGQACPARPLANVSNSILIGSFAFGQVGWTDGLSGIEWIFQRDSFGPDVTTAALGLLESVVGHKSGHHVGMRRNQDTEGFARTSDRVSISFGPRL
jgi:hypothetical protein